MGKVAMLFALAASFCNAVWLIIWRRTPNMSGGIAGRRGIFVFLTLYFMYCLGADVLAGESGAGADPATQIAAGADDSARFYDLVASVWIALGYMARGDMLAYAGEPEVRDAYRKAQARKDSEATLELRRSYSDKTRILRQRQFEYLMTKAADSGRVSRQSSALLITLYNRLSSRFESMHTTCYMRTPLRKEIQTADPLASIEEKIQKLIGDPEPNMSSRDGLVGDLYQMQQHLIESAEALMFEYKEDDQVENYERKKQELEKLEKNRCELQDLRQAANLLIKIAPRLPKDWGKPNHNYD